MCGESADFKLTVIDTLTSDLLVRNRLGLPRLRGLFGGLDNGDHAAGGFRGNIQRSALGHMGVKVRIELVPIAFLVLDFALHGDAFMLRIERKAILEVAAGDDSALVA